MIKRLFLLFLFFSLFLHAQHDPLGSDDEDLALYHHVDVIHGHLNLCMQDALVEGAHTLPLLRTYSSAGALERSSEDYDLFYQRLRGVILSHGGWSLMPHTTFLVERGQEIESIRAYVSEPSGGLITYVFSGKEGYTVYLKPEKGSSRASGVLSARTNSENAQLTLHTKKGEATLHLADGGIRFYSGTEVHKFNPQFQLPRPYRISSEILPSRHQIHYSYNEKKQLRRIAVKTPQNSKTLAWIEFDHFSSQKDPLRFRARTSDKKWVDYTCTEFKDRNFLSHVNGPVKTGEHYIYSPGRKSTGARVELLQFAGNAQLKASYFLPADEKEEQLWVKNPKRKNFNADKVRQLEAPIGPGGSLATIAQFGYAPDHTDVRDQEAILTRYYHSEERIQRIEYFDQHDQLHSTLLLVWEGNRLGAKVLMRGCDEPLLSKTFQYDTSGNVIKETVWGNLTGHATGPFSLQSNGALNGAESYTKRYSYLPYFNVPLSEEEEGGLTYRYEYREGTNLLIAKRACLGDQVLRREFFIYNDDHLLVGEISDDGTCLDPNNTENVHQRTLKRYELHPDTGLPVVIKELYYEPSSQKECLLKKRVLTYSPENRLVEEAVYDAEEIYRYTLHTHYDIRGNVIAKSTPKGATHTYLYDENNNLLESKEVGSLQKNYTYDSLHRPIRCVETDLEGNHRDTHSHYDTKGRLVALTDPSGETTHQIYDSFGRCLETQLPPVQDETGSVYLPRIQFSFDVHGNLASTTSPSGLTTRTSYTSLRKPIRIQQPDQTEILHTYNKNGTLAETCYSDGTRIAYSYDLFQRPLSKSIYDSTDSLLSQESWCYKGALLFSYTNPRGLQTHYFYDGAGRKVKEESDGRIRSFSYDALGFLTQTTEADRSYIQKKDEEDHVIEEWEETPLGKTENMMRFTYDQKGLKIAAERLTSKGWSHDFFSYDGRRRLIQHTDPLGGVTRYIYNDQYTNTLGQNVLQKTTIDPIGLSTRETYDIANRLIYVEKLDLEQKIVSKEEFSYDRAGNRAKRLTTVYQGNQPLKQLLSTWSYDAMGRVTDQLEEQVKRTQYTYDCRGRIIKKTLPNGTLLLSTYDGIDRLLTLTSSDGTIDYRYRYLQGPDPISFFDAVHSLEVERRYNAFGELIEERTASGHLSRWEYDQEGRCSAYVLPDSSSIHYVYTDGHLTAIERRNAQGQLHYIHRYCRYDENGHVSEEELFYGSGILQTERDLLERPTRQNSPWLNQSVTYGPSHLIEQIDSSIFGKKEYQYDALNQICKEGEKTYAFDSVGNPTTANIGPCNQLLDTPTARLTYDPNGNPLLCTGPQGETHYTYDALGRLTSIQTPDRTTSFLYDPLSRLYSKETAIQNSGSWESVDKYFYLYDRENEIGTLHPNGTIKQLKVLGLGLKGPIGATVAIENNDRVYAPIHDFAGNIIGLISPKGKLLETYQIDAFGQEILSSSTPSSPWRFCSKRTEENLVFFGHRFYDPSLKRWLTPDPAGFIDGPNLYLYVLNSPLNRLDLFGLFAEDKFTNFKIEVPLSMIMKVDAQHLQVQTQIGEVSVDWFISCGHWHKIQFSPEELKAGKINIIDHLHELVPKDGMIVGLLTAQNGINNSTKDFKKMSESITSKVPEGTLFIGLHNASEGIVKDIKRATNERLNVDTPIVAKTSQFFGAIIDQLHAINPKLLWMHIAHSEGGAIAARAIELLTPDQRSLLKRHLYYYGVAPAMPMPKSYAFEAANVYSRKDKVTLRYAESLIGDIEYHIRLLPSISPFYQKNFFLADHAFLGDTYQKEFRSQINEMRYIYGFYKNNSN